MDIRDRRAGKRDQQGLSTVDVAEEQRIGSTKRRPLPVKEWFTVPGADMSVRRHDVWTLLGWYHMTVVQPQLGWKGFFRTLWWSLTGYQPRSPWAEIHTALELRRARLRAEDARAAESGKPTA